MNYLFLDTNFEEIEAVTTIDLLRRANIALTTVSVTGSPYVMGAHQIEVKADCCIADCDFSDAGMLILPGGHDINTKVLQPYNHRHDSMPPVPGSHRRHPCNCTCRSRRYILTYAVS